MNDWYEKLAAEVQGQIRRNELLSKYTTMRIGGPVCAWVVPKDILDLKRVVDFSRGKNIPLKVIGRGTNILFSDKGYQGIVVCLKNDSFKQVNIDTSTHLLPIRCAQGCLSGCPEQSEGLRSGLPHELSRVEQGATVRAGAGVSLSELISVTTRANLSGIEFFSGIPATLGGLVMTNAGVRVPDRDCSMDVGELVQEVKVLDRDGQVRTLDKDKLVFSYRWSNLKGFIILEVCLNLINKPLDEIRAVEGKIRDHRKDTQPLDALSCGCVFQNPSSSDLSSGQLIDACGLKGKQIGRAMISDKHANFIINKGEAKAGQVLELLNLAQKKVWEKFKIKLELEIEIIN